MLEKSWVASKEILTDVKKVIIEAEKIIKDEKKLFQDHEIVEKITSALPHLTKTQLINFLKVSSRIKKNKFEKWGMIDWLEVNPKGTREKVYLILKEHKKPLHFVEIASLIDKYKLGKRKAHPQTVHNELIKDNRFILIGRGIYALSEWGYSEGTIRDVIKMILEKSAKPLNKEKIIEEVLKIRRVKKTTIMINLSKSKFFEKKGDLYTIKK
jgi:DNA-directed RNA polymerase delta subunit